MKVRFFLAALAGIVVAIGLISGIEAVGQSIYPPPAGLDFSDAEQVRAYMQALPLGKFLLVLGAWVTATFVGGSVAAWIARARPFVFTGLVGAVILAASIANLALIPHPLWFSVLAVIAIPLSAFIAGSVASRNRLIQIAAA